MEERAGKARKATRRPPPPVKPWRPYKGHPGLTLPYQGWADYPVLQERKATELVQVDKHNHAEVRCYLQDGIPVMGYSFTTNNSGGGCAPGRKWGEFTSLKAAERYAWSHIEQRIASDWDANRQTKKLLQLVREKLRPLTPGEQLTLNL